MTLGLRTCTGKMSAQLQKDAFTARRPLGVEEVTAGLHIHNSFFCFLLLLHNELMLICVKKKDLIKNNNLQFSIILTDEASVFESFFQILGTVVIFFQRYWQFHKVIN
jgi:hypothetical protein